MFVVTQTHVQSVVPNVIKHKMFTEFSYNFACFNPPLCVPSACFLPCDDWTAFSILATSPPPACLACFSKLTEQCSIVRLFRLWDNIILFCLRAVGLNCNSTLIRELKNFEVLGSILQHWFCDRNLETFLSPPPLYPNLEAQGSRTWEESKLVKI